MYARGFGKCSHLQQATLRHLSHEYAPGCACMMHDVSHLLWANGRTCLQGCTSVQDTHELRAELDIDATQGCDG